MVAHQRLLLLLKMLLQFVPSRPLLAQLAQKSRLLLALLRQLRLQLLRLKRVVVDAAPTPAHAPSPAARQRSRGRAQRRGGQQRRRGAQKLVLIAVLARLAVVAVVAGRPGVYLIVEIVLRMTRARALVAVRIGQVVIAIVLVCARWRVYFGRGSAVVRIRVVSVVAVALELKIAERSAEFAFGRRSSPPATLYARIVELNAAQVERVVGARHDAFDNLVVHFAAHDLLVYVRNQIVDA